MIAVLAGFGAVVAVVLAVGGWRLWHLDRRIMIEVDGQLDHLWNEMARAHRAHSLSTARRVEQAEATVELTARGHQELARHMDWVESWVRHWASTPPTD